MGAVPYLFLQAALYVLECFSPHILRHLKITPKVSSPKKEIPFTILFIIFNPPSVHFSFKLLLIFLSLSPYHRHIAESNAEFFTAGYAAPLPMVNAASADYFFFRSNSLARASFSLFIFPFILSTAISLKILPATKPATPPIMGDKKNRGKIPHNKAGVTPGVGAHATHEPNHDTIPIVVPIAAPLPLPPLSMLCFCSPNGLRTSCRNIFIHSSMFFS